MKKIIITFIICLLPVLITAQPKIGTVGAADLLYTPLVVSNGMGETGVAASGYQSGFHNPASLGMFSLNNCFSATGFLGKPEIYYAEFYSSQANLPLRLLNLPDEKLNIIFNYSFRKRTMYFEETTYEFPEGTGRILELNISTSNYSIAAGYSFKQIELGVGGSMGIYKEKLSDINNDVTFFDLGLMLSYNVPIALSESDYKSHLKLSSGISLSNLGSNFKYDYSDIYYDLPKTRRIGFSLNYRLDYDPDRIIDYALFSVNPAIEWETTRQLHTKQKYGVDFGLFDLFHYRIGHVGEDDIRTNGYSFSSQGLYKTIVFLFAKNKRVSHNSIFGNKINLVYDQAVKKYSAPYNLDDSKYHSLTILFQL